MTNNRFPVLVARIPSNGRTLTATEARALRALGVSIPRGARIQQAHASDYIGALYRPAPGGLAALGVSVTLRPDK